MLRSNTSSAIGPEDELIGICPPKLFPDRFRIFRQGRENSDSGRFPSKLFQDIFNCRKFLRFLTTAKCVGTCDDYGYGVATSIYTGTPTSNSKILYYLRLEEFRSFCYS